MISENEFRIAATSIEAAKAPEDIFGALTGSEAERLRAITVEYRALTLVTHPDRHDGSFTLVRRRATAVFARLSTMKTQAEEKVRAGTYGNRAVAAPSPAPPMAPITVETKLRRYRVTERLFQGDYCDLYQAFMAAKRDRSGEEEPVIFKVTQAPADNDLLEHEAAVLGKLFPPKESEEKTTHRLLPRLLDTLKLQGKRGTRPRQVNIFRDHRDHFSLAEVHRVHPALDFRDVVWMFKRALMVLGLAHRKGIVHGAVLPPHLLVQPVDHGIKLLDWSYAAELPKGRVKAKIKAYDGFYPREVAAKEVPSPATDLFMLAKCVVYALGGNVAGDVIPPEVPKPFADFLRACLLASPARRPQDAWSLHEDLNALLAKVVGKPAYRLLAMPART